jgi:hypothetical protein
LAVVRRFASYALVVAVTVTVAGCAGSQTRVAVSSPPASLVREVHSDNRVGPGPFVPAGGWTGGGGSGLWGDGASGPSGTSLGCLDDRHYSYAFGVENTSKARLTVDSARGPSPAPAIVDRVATQLWLSPPQRPRPSTITNFGGGAGFDLVYHGWSAARTRPVTVPPHRVLTIQINFVMHNCDRLEDGRTVTVPGSLVLEYGTRGHGGRQTLALPANRFVVGAGPTRHVCAPVSGSGSLVAADVGCAFARRAAPICHAMKNGGWLGCTVAGRSWDCGRFAGPGYPLLETCYLPHLKSHWFSVVWIGPGLGLWGAIADRPGQTRRGVCEDRPAGMPLEFESRTLRILRGKAGARGAANARVTFSVRNYHGSGRHSAKGAVTVVIQGHGTYVANAGRLTISRVTNRAVSGLVFASLRQANGKRQASLNGTWSCRTTVG